MNNLLGQLNLILKQWIQDAGLMSIFKEVDVLQNPTNKEEYLLSGRVILKNVKSIEDAIDQLVSIEKDLFNSKMNSEFVKELETVFNEQQKEIQRLKKYELFYKMTYRMNNGKKLRREDN